MAINPLKNYHILLADGDVELSRVLRSMMIDMGFIHCDVAHDGYEAYHMLQSKPYDFLIAEWAVGKMPELELLRKIRRAPDSPNPTLPVIMLTGRSETADVLTARDVGINEFVVKPFAAKTIYNRVERIIEHPRQFVMASSFVGPTRRAKSTPPPGVQDRRISKPLPQLQPADLHGAMRSSHVPKVWLPDFSLKYKLGTNVTLDSLITPAVLEQAQAAVNAIGDASLGWIKDNLQEMRALLAQITAGDISEQARTTMGDLALTINSRAGTFGYDRASEIAYLLYLFCRNRMNPRNPAHHRVIEKHIDVLHVVLGNQMRGHAGAIGDQMVAELKKLADKFDTG